MSVNFSLDLLNLILTEDSKTTLLIGQTESTLCLLEMSLCWTSIIVDHLDHDCVVFEDVGSCCVKAVKNIGFNIANQIWL